MKFFRHIALYLSLLFLPVVACSQDTGVKWRRPNAVKTNLIGPLSLYYERAIAPRLALRSSFRRWKIPKGALQQDVVNVTMEAKFFTFKLDRLQRTSHPNGFFVNPYIKVRQFRVSDHVGLNPDVYEKESVRSLGFGLAAGYQWVFRRVFVLEVFHGFGAMPTSLTRYRRYESDGSITTRMTNEYYKYDMRSGLSVGFAF